MKIALAIILLFLIKAPLAVGADFELLMDCGTNRVFVGEKIVCQFIITGDTDIVEVEVIKFPEFRGFWSENLSLRQGPIALGGIPTGTLLKKQAVVGSYSIHRMVDKNHGEIIPMKISLRPRDRSNLFSPSLGNPIILESRSLPLSMIPLPPVPHDLKNLPFIGAVGEFSFTQKEVSLEYRLDEPVELKISLEGKGNFTEINTLPLLQPEDSEVTSQRTFMQSIGNGTAKTFEFSILLKSPPAETHRLGQFLFFNPSKKIFQTIALPTIRFFKANPKSQGDSISFQLPEPETQWSFSKSYLNSLVFWLVQLVGLGFCSFYTLRFRKHEKEQREKDSLAFKRQQIWRDALAAQRSGDPTKFIQLATLAFTQLLKEKGRPLNMRFSNYPTRRQLVASVKQSLTPEQQSSIEALFSAYDQIYSPEKPADLHTLIDSLGTHLDKIQ